MKLADMPEIDLVDVTVEEVEQMLFDTYKNMTGRTLGKADPVRLFLLFVAEVLFRICNKVNYAGRQNLLRTAEGKNLDALAANLCVTRTPAAPAKTVLRITLSAARATSMVIPKGTRVSPKDSGVYFATDEETIIPAGKTTAEVPASCTTAGLAGNGFLAGEISKIVDPVAYVDTMENTVATEGGSDEESDESLRERVFEAPERFSTAGPSGAYEYYTRSASDLITDVCVWSPSPGCVQVVFLLKGGEVPGKALLDTVDAALQKGGVRPLTDKVEVIAPQVVKYDIDVGYSINSDADAAIVQKQVTEAVNQYIAWQKEKLNRDIDPSELIHRIKTVPGTCHIVVNKPAYTVVGRDVGDTTTSQAVQVAYANTMNITMNGRED